MLGGVGVTVFCFRGCQTDGCPTPTSPPNHKPTQEEVLARHQHQEELFTQNAKLLAAVRAACDPADWRTAQAEMGRLAEEVEGMQAAVAGLRREAARAQVRG